MFMLGQPGQPWPERPVSGANKSGSRAETDSDASALVGGRGDVDRFGRKITGNDRWKELAQTGRYGRHVVVENVLECPPSGTEEGRGLKCFESLGPILAAVTPGHMNVVVGFEMVSTEVVLGLLHPDTRPHLDIGNPGLFIQFPQRGGSGILTPTDPSTGNLQPLGLVWIDRILCPNQKNTARSIKENTAGGGTTKRERHERILMRRVHISICRHPGRSRDNISSDAT